MTRGEGDVAPLDIGTTERRRGIELVLSRQPEIGLDELQRILGRVGVAVDVDTLLEDLDALGYEVDDVEPRADHHHDDAARPRQWLVIAAAAVVVLVIIIAVVLTGGRDDDSTTTDAGPGDGLDVTGSGIDGGSAPLPGPTEPVVVAPVGPGSDPALDVPETHVDDFERAGIGDFPDVGTYEVLAGEWTNTDGNLDLTAPADPIALVAIDPGTDDVRAQVDVDRRAPRAGIAFRIVDAENFFVWAPVPELATNVLFRVVDGEALGVVDSGLTTTGDGLPALGINIVGSTVELLNEGVVVATYDQLPPADGATRIGLAALGGSDALPLFDQLRILIPDEAEGTG